MTRKLFPGIVAILALGTLAPQVRAQGSGTNDPAGAGVTVTFTVPQLLFISLDVADVDFEATVSDTETGGIGDGSRTITTRSDRPYNLTDQVSRDFSNPESESSASLTAGTRTPGQTIATVGSPGAPGYALDSAGDYEFPVTYALIPD